jgi:hypothetical protein
MMRRLVPVRAGEGRAVLGVGLIAVLYSAAVGIGDLVSQSIFVGRAGAEALPRIFLLKAAIDVGAALLYLPMTRGRRPPAVLRLTLVIYIATVLAGHALVATSGGTAPAYLLYVGHECAWTILTIHWGVYLLDIFDASQARRLFPILFGVTRLGGALAGLVVGAWAAQVGAAPLLYGASAFAAAALVVSFAPSTAPHRAAAPALGESPAEAVLDDEAAVRDAQPGLLRRWLRGWREAARSPLVRAIATSTALMVATRYALRLVSSTGIERAFAGDEDQIAGFLGQFDAIANTAGAVIGVLVLPRLLTRVGVGVVNLAYAVATALAPAAALLVPSLATAAGARFVETALKDAIKTPLSALFYGAEPPADRAPARALVFGAVIPLATLAAAAGLEIARMSDDPLATAAGFGLGAAVVFVAATWQQNRAWRSRLRELLDWSLAREKSRGGQPDPDRLALAERELDGEALTPIARALASTDRRLRAVAEEVLAETIERRAAHRIARALDLQDEKRRD